MKGWGTWNPGKLVKTQANIFPSAVLFQNRWEFEGCLLSVLFPSSPPAPLGEVLESGNLDSFQHSPVILMHTAAMRLC